MIYQGMIGVIRKGLCNHPCTLTFDSSLLFKLKEQMTLARTHNRDTVRLSLNNSDESKVRVQG